MSWDRRTCTMIMLVAACIHITRVECEQVGNRGRKPCRTTGERGPNNVKGSKVDQGGQG